MTTILSFLRSRTRVGRALMSNPRLLILGHATEGLAHIVWQEIWADIRRLKAERGLAILIVDRSLRELSSVVETAVFLNRGATVWHGAMSVAPRKIVTEYIGV